MNYFLLKLAFDTAVHFGGSDSAVGSQSSALTLRADTIFSALCHTALEVYGEPALEELLVSADADALRISHALAGRYLLPTQADRRIHIPCRAFHR